MEPGAASGAFARGLIVVIDDESSIQRTVSSDAQVRLLFSEIG
jgi:hypothetical protein